MRAKYPVRWRCDGSLPGAVSGKGLLLPPIFDPPRWQLLLNFLIELVGCPPAAHSPNIKKPRTSLGFDMQPSGSESAPVPNPLPCSGFVGLLHFVLHQTLHQVLLGIAVPSTQARRADAADLNILPRRIRFFLSSSFLAGDGGLGLWLACQ